MKVRDLLVVLAHVDPDLDVHVASTWGQHLGRVECWPRRPAARMHPWIDEHGPRVCDPSLMLRGDGSWFRPPPPWELRGRFRDRVGLDAELAALTGEPA